MKLIRITALIISTLAILSCQSKQSNDPHQDIVNATNTIYDSLVKIRRDIHKFPELSLQEERTSKLVATYLERLGLEVITDVGGKGVVGILKGGKQGRNIAWRADMDAIRSNDPDPVSFRSKHEGVRHGCGHDVHTTIALGIANVLSQQKEHLKGTVYFIFQPAEETATGAKAMIDDGLFDTIKPDEIYGLHIGPEATGVINYKSNELFAYQRSYKVKFKSNPDTKELEQFMNSVLNSFNRNIEFNGSPWDIINQIGDPTVGLGSETTIFKDYFILQGSRLEKGKDATAYSASILETNRDLIDSIPNTIKAQILNSKFKDDFITIESSGADLTPLNDPALTVRAADLLSDIYGENKVKPLYGQIPFFGEDFIYYQHKVPGVFFLLGASNSEEGILSMPHTPNFVVDETVIKHGVESFASLILERINN